MTAQVELEQLSTRLELAVGGLLDVLGWRIWVAARTVGGSLYCGESSNELCCDEDGGDSKAAPLSAHSVRTRKAKRSEVWFRVRLL